MTNCNYKWTNTDANAERGPDGKKLHPFHVCVNLAHGLGTHKCKCGAIRVKDKRNR
jgi:hypothetical protein